MKELKTALNLTWKPNSMLITFSTNIPPK
jgi:hypothetical protein